ncbi:TPR repeat-containing protein [Paramagnetospirillum caucaseum]|uniref:TPR repeat-containing protein n=1 Tax=Paramagnetospirillum caucaseum TaxID=1244869 RepID=M2ZSG2_9PROT|nr:tetratricopeptide repeat protein [Paramagnetospirillum caucaseum]EME70287.1 TPR repeat-containing protein [Paramagnetospirillum caucaseum]
MGGDPLAEAFARIQAGDLAGAAAVYRQALEAGADDPRLRMSLGQLLLLQGDYRRGLPLNEHRPQKPIPGPRWRGQPLKGETVLVVGEQGFGDNIQFVRYAEPLARRGARVVVGCQPGLGRLLSTTPGVSAVLESGQAMTPPDFMVPMMSLPYLFGTTAQTIPARVPYLTPLPEAVAAWRARLAPHGGLKVGLVWGGNPDVPYDGRRSPGLAPCLSLLDVPGVTVFSLQKGPAAAALAGRSMPPNFIDLGPQLTDFDQTAAVMQALDLVISSCTAPAHLAGALGRPVWVVLADFPDWRWLLDREDSPWYPTARLFRARHGEGWDQVAGRVRGALTAAAGGG